MNENERKVTFGYLYTRKHKYLNNKNSWNLKHKRILFLKKRKIKRDKNIHFESFERIEIIKKRIIICIYGRNLFFPINIFWEFVYWYNFKFYFIL